MQLAVKPRARSGTETRQKQQRTTVRWNPCDYAELMARVERAGQSIGTYIRSCCLSAPTTGARRHASVDVAVAAKVLGAINKMGGNLHQIVRYRNFGGAPLDDEIHAALRGYDAMVAAVMAAFGQPL
jgi:hypothetical protein